MRAPGGAKGARHHSGAAASAALVLLVSVLPAARLLAEGAAPETLARLAADARVWRAALHTLEVAAGSTVGAVLVGGGAAIALSLLRVPAARLLAFLFVLAMLIPPQIAALAWLSALGPSSPLLGMLGLAPPLGAPHPLHGPLGIILLLSVQTAPIVFLSVRAGLRQVPAEQIEAARSLGAAWPTVLCRVLLPLAAPALASGAALAALAAIGNFGTTAMLGLPARYTVLSVLVFSRLSALGPGGLNEAAGISLLLAAMAGAVLAAQAFLARRRPVANLSDIRPLVPVPAGRAGVLVALVLGLYLLAVLALPVASLLVAALTPAIGVALTAETATLANFAAVLAPGANVFQALGNSLLLAGAAAALLAAMALGLVLGRPQGRGSFLSAAIDLPYALPGVCVGVAMILVYLRPLPLLGVSLYGTLGLILIAYLARFLALALKPVEAAAAAMNPRLAEAAAILGAGPWRVARSIALPILAPAAAAGLLLVALTALNEITVSILLYAAGSQTLGVMIFSLNDSGQTGMAAATALLALALVAVLMALASLAARRLPQGTLPWQA